MPHPISPLGAAHTLISLVPAFAGLYSFVRYRGCLLYTSGRQDMGNGLPEAGG